MLTARKLWCLSVIFIFVAIFLLLKRNGHTWIWDYWEMQAWHKVCTLWLYFWNNDSTHFLYSWLHQLGTSVMNVGGFLFPISWSWLYVYIYVVLKSLMISWWNFMVLIKSVHSLLNMLNLDIMIFILIFDYQVNFVTS